MKNSSLAIDERLIDDLVTGQLVGEQYRMALLALEAEPCKWRECALAFLVEQALRSDLSALARIESQCWRPATVASHSTNLDDAGLSSRPRVNQVPIATDQTVATSTRQAGSRSRRRLRDSAWLSPSAVSTAALLLVSFLIGWLGSELTSATYHPQSTAGSASVSSNGQALPSPTQARLSVPSNSEMGLPPSESEAPWQYVFKQKDSFLPLDRAVPPQLAALEREGKIHLDSLDGIVPVTSDDGSFALVPVQMFRVLPVMLTY